MYHVPGSAADWRANVDGGIVITIPSTEASASSAVAAADAPY